MATIHDVWYQERVRAISEAIIKAQAINPMGRPFIVGIDGLGCAGKSTLVEILDEALQGYDKKLQVLHIDDFIVQKPLRDDTTARTLAENYYDVQFRYDYLKDTVLTPMRQGKRGGTDVEIYNHKTDGYDLRKVNLAPDIAILEGVFIHRPELEGFLDLSIFMAIDRKTQIERAFIRGNNGPNEEAIRWKYKNKYFPAEDRYLNECNPAKKADIIFDVTREKIVYNNKSLAYSMQRKPLIPRGGKPELIVPKKSPIVPKKSPIVHKAR